MHERGIGVSHRRAASMAKAWWVLPGGVCSVLSGPIVSLSVHVSQPTVHASLCNLIICHGHHGHVPWLGCALYCTHVVWSRLRRRQSMTHAVVLTLTPALVQ